MSASSERPQRQCFKCGVVGHGRDNCPEPVETEAGKKAWADYKAYKPGKRPSAADGHSSSGRYTPLQRIRKRLLPSILPGADPVWAAAARGKKMSGELQSAAWNHFQHGIDTIETVLNCVFNESDAKAKRAAAAGADAKAGAGAEIVTATLASASTPATPGSSAAATAEDLASGKSMTRQLEKAVDSGVHADFTVPAELVAYTKARLNTRVRYLHALLLADDPISAAVRKMLLPTRLRSPDELQVSSATTTKPPSTPPAQTPTQTPTQTHTPLLASLPTSSPPPPPPPPLAPSPPLLPAVIRSLSVGGGPGFDDVALRLVAGFLATDALGTKGVANDIPHSSSMAPAPVIETTVLDLFERNWATAVDAVAVATAAATKLGLAAAAVDTVSNLSHCDVTLPLDSPCGANVALAERLPSANLLIFSFVLHENAIGLLNGVESENGVVGVGAGGGDDSDVGGDSSARPRKGTPNAGGTRNSSSSSSSNVGSSSIGAGSSSSSSSSSSSGSSSGSSNHRAAVDTIRGVFPGLFAGARIGTVILCLDAGHRLWPMVVETGRKYGWRASIPRSKRGPSSCIALERIATSGDDATVVEERWCA